MKRIFMIITVLALLLSTCSCKSQMPETYKLGMGVLVNADDTKDGKVIISSTLAAVALDADGKIKECKIDVLEASMVIDGGIVERGGTYKSKVEQGDAYGMKEASPIGREWYEQAEHFEKYAVGKTADEIANIAEGDSDLAAGCTVDVSDFKKAVVKAANDSYAKSFTAEKPELRVGFYTDDSSSVSASNDAIGLCALYSTFTCAAVENGEIKAILFDQSEPSVTFSHEGEVTGVIYDGTKKEQGDTYGMQEYSDEGLEWYEQAGNFEDYMAGRTVDSIDKLEIGADTVSGCTIDCSPFVRALAASMKNEE